MERHAGDCATTGADCLVHLAWRARRAALVAPRSRIRTAVALSSARSAAIWAASWLAESTAGIEVLLAGGKAKTLATIAAGQCHVARHVVDGSLETNESRVRSVQLARARSPVSIGFRRHEKTFTDEERCQPSQCTRWRSRFARRGPNSFRVTQKKGSPHLRGDPKDVQGSFRSDCRYIGRNTLVRRVTFPVL